MCPETSLWPKCSELPRNRFHWDYEPYILNMENVDYEVNFTHTEDVYPTTLSERCTHWINTLGLTQSKRPKHNFPHIFWLIMCQLWIGSSVSFINETHIVSCGDCNAWLRCPFCDSDCQIHNAVYQLTVFCFCSSHSSFIRENKLLLLCVRAPFS